MGQRVRVSGDVFCLDVVPRLLQVGVTRMLHVKVCTDF